MSSRPPTSSPPLSASEPAGARRCGYVALVGRPNAGKSTLFNAFLGQRLSIVTARPQTTRGRILGVLTTASAQAIFLDTPGLLEPAYRLHQTMAHQIERSVREADAVLLLIDATAPWDRRQLVDAFLARARAPLLGALNKCDVVPPGRLEALVAEVRDGFGLPEVAPVSALRGDGVGDLLDRTLGLLPPGPMLYPEEMVAEQPERFFVAELIREAAFQQLTDELPYAINVSVEEFTDPAGQGEGDTGGSGRRRGTKAYVGATIYVERESQKGIVIGRGGTRLRSIGQEARKQIEAMLERPVYLELWVKVRPDWRDREQDLREFGYL
ncbi:MAG: GTPase Era [Gemmatimonadota bacterium]